MGCTTVVVPVPADEPVVDFVSTLTLDVDVVFITGRVLPESKDVLSASGEVEVIRRLGAVIASPETTETVASPIGTGGGGYSGFIVSFSSSNSRMINDPPCPCASAPGIFSSAGGGAGWGGPKGLFGEVLESEEGSASGEETASEGEGFEEGDRAGGSANRALCAAHQHVHSLRSVVAFPSGGGLEPKLLGKSSDEVVPSPVPVPDPVPGFIGGGLKPTSALPGSPYPLSMNTCGFSSSTPVSG